MPPFQNRDLCAGAFRTTTRERLATAVGILLRDQRQARLGGCAGQANHEIAHPRELTSGGQVETVMDLIVALLSAGVVLGFVVVANVWYWRRRARLSKHQKQHEDRPGAEEACW
jgi:hypothetical protein